MALSIHTTIFMEQRQPVFLKEASTLILIYFQRIYFFFKKEAIIFYMFFMRIQIISTTIQIILTTIEAILNNFNCCSKKRDKTTKGHTTILLWKNRGKHANHIDLPFTNNFFNSFSKVLLWHVQIKYLIHDFAAPHYMTPIFLSWANKAAIVGSEEKHHILPWLILVFL
ncbi:hypothetical protein ACJX0J_012953 [Zea mays]